MGATRVRDLSPERFWSKKASALSGQLLEKQAKHAAWMARRRNGETIENRFFLAFDGVRLPSWLTSIQPSSEYEDEKGGIDALLYTDRGVIQAQIKSSTHGAEKYRKQTGHSVMLVILTMEMDCEEIRRKVLKTAHHYYKRLCRRI